MLIFLQLIGSGDFVIPVEAGGSAPITWSLDLLSERYPTPDNASIDEKHRGVYLFRDGLETGTYYFVIRASNSVEQSPTGSVLISISVIPTHAFATRSGRCALMDVFGRCLSADNACSR
jgi:hypothetical protein